MTGVGYRRGQWLGTNGDAGDQPTGELELVQQHDPDAPPDSGADRGADRGLRVVAVLCALLAAAWVAVAIRSALIAPPVGIAALATRIGAACPPLVLIGIVYLIVARTSRRESGRLARVSASLRAEQARLDAALTRTTERIAGERTSIGEHADQLLMIGDDAAHRLRLIGEGLRRDIEVLAREAAEIATASAQARSDLGVLTDGLPHARAQVDALVVSIDTAGQRAHERTGALDAAVAALGSRAREVDDVAGGAAHRLSAQLARVEGTSAAATGAIVAATDTMTGAIDRTLAHATQAADVVRHVVADQSEAMLAIVAQGEAALARTSADTAAKLRERVEAVTQQMIRLTAALDEQRQAGARIVDDLGMGIDRVDERFAAFGEHARMHGAQIDARLGALAAKNDALASSFGDSGTAADALIERAEVLLTAIDAVTREIDETLPASLDRLDTRTAASIEQLETAVPRVEHIAGQASDALDRLVRADAVLTRQQSGLALLGNTGRAELAAARQAAQGLLATVAEAKRETAETADAANTELTQAFAAAGASARHAVDEARAALASFAPDVADRLAQAVHTALESQIEDGVAARVAALGATAERAVAAANQASDRLMRQMLTIAETSAQVEARIAEARSETEDADRDDFSRRVALLIESLNSTAIDVARMLSNDVGDAAWASYLKGDRGVFARRAVRLLDAAEVREVARHYADDSDFREQVNRYIHDFESMLRNVLATRNGSPLGVTLLSSDMGKLYVALAQAIERLRT